MKRHPCLLESLKRSKEASRTLLLALNKDLDYCKTVIGTKFYAPQILEGVRLNPTNPPAYATDSNEQLSDSIYKFKSFDNHVTIM